MGSRLSGFGPGLPPALNLILPGSHFNCFNQRHFSQRPACRLIVSALLHSYLSRAVTSMFGRGCGGAAVGRSRERWNGLVSEPRRWNGLWSEPACAPEVYQGWNAMGTRWWNGRNGRRHKRRRIVLPWAIITVAIAPGLRSATSASKSAEEDIRYVWRARCLYKVSCACMGGRSELTPNSPNF